jgi:hypothetical protein
MLGSGLWEAERVIGHGQVVAQLPSIPLDGKGRLEVS